MNAPVLEVNVRRRLGAFLLDVAFSAREGIAALVGPSGSGKTLTLRAIAGLLRPDLGRVVLGERVLFERTGVGQSIIDMPARDRRVGYVFQHYALFPHMTARENISYGLKGLRAREREERVNDMLTVVRLTHQADRHPNALSGGEQQRVALARALAPRPSLLLLDEPLSALDAPLRLALGRELRRMHQDTGVPMLLVTHDPAEAARIADMTVRLQDGRAEAG